MQSSLQTIRGWVDNGNKPINRTTAEARAMIAIGPANEPVLGDLKATNKPSNEAHLKFLGLRNNQPILPFQTGEKTTCPLPILLISCFRIWRHLTNSGAKTGISGGGLPNAVARRSCGRFCGQFQHRRHGAQWDGRVHENVVGSWEL